MWIRYLNLDLEFFIYLRSVGAHSNSVLPAKLKVSVSRITSLTSTVVSSFDVRIRCANSKWVTLVIALSTVIHWIIFISAFKSANCVHTDLSCYALSKSTSTLIDIDTAFWPVRTISNK